MSAKLGKRISLVGLDVTGKHVSTGKDVVRFGDINDTIVICNHTDKFCELYTRKDIYKLIKHLKLNIYTGTCNGHRVHVSLKKIVGELRYW